MAASAQRARNARPKGRVRADGGPDLTKHTEGSTSACMKFPVPGVRRPHRDRHTWDCAGDARQLRAAVVASVGGGDELSDHCPIAVVFESDGPVEPSEAITVLLDRLDAVTAELADIRASLAALRE